MVYLKSLLGAIIRGSYLKGDHTKTRTVVIKIAN
jgi:hypothetical protein